MDANDPSTALPADDPRSPESIERRRRLGIAERDPHGRLHPGSKLPGAGRKPDGPFVMALARAHTLEAIEVLANVMADARSPPAAKVAAAQALLDRGWGKAPILVDLAHKSRFDDFLRDLGIEVASEGEEQELDTDDAEPAQGD
jgi:hypothetical protein